MTPDEIHFFPAAAVPLYELFRESMLTLEPDTVFSVKKTQISLQCGKMYGCVSLPRRKAEREAGWLLITFGLPYQVRHERILTACEPYPNRWTHHMLLHSADEIDDTLLGWLREACAFAARK